MARRKVHVDYLRVFDEAKTRKGLRDRVEVGS